MAKERLKLRQHGDGTAELIAYHRSDVSGPKISEKEEPVATRCVLKIVLLSSALCLIPAPAAARHGVRLVPLKDVIKRSDAVIVARPLVPLTDAEPISIVPKGKKPDPQKYPPYRKVSYRLQVRSVLFADPEEKLTGQLLVAESGWRDGLRWHRDRHLKGIDRGYRYHQFRTTADPERAAKAKRPLIFFLKKDGDGYRLTVRDAFAPMRLTKEVKALLKERVRPGPPARPLPD